MYLFNDDETAALDLDEHVQAARESEYGWIDVRSIRFTQNYDHDQE